MHIGLQIQNVGRVLGLESLSLHLFPLLLSIYTVYGDGRQNSDRYSPFSVVEPAPSNMATSMGKSCPSLPARCGGVSRLMVTPRVSGLERSQEKSLELHFPEPISSSSSSSSTSSASFCLPSHSPVTALGTVTRPSPINGNGSRPNGSPPLSKHKAFLTMPGRSQSIYNINNRCVTCEYLRHVN